MADWAHAFLSKVILEEQMGAAVNARITTEFFRNDEQRNIFQFMLDHFGKHGTPPDEQVVAQAFPTARWKPQKQALTYLIERMQQDRKFVILTQGLSAAADFVQTEQPDEISDVIQEALIQSRLETSNSLDNDFTKARLSVEELLVDRMDNPGMLRGISTGFNGIDYVTGGLQPEQFIVLMGTPKTFKSGTALAMALGCPPSGQDRMLHRFRDVEHRTAGPHGLAALRCEPDQDHERHAHREGIQSCPEGTTSGGRDAPAHLLH